MECIWRDEFDGNELDLNVWEIQHGTGAKLGLKGWGNNEAQFYHADNVTVRDGLLRIEARQEVRDCPVEGRRAYTSGRIRSTGATGFSTQYGRIEARIKLPAGNGLWPAFWMLPTHSPYGGWPMSGEIDIMEAKGRTPARSSGALHYGSRWPHHTYSHFDHAFPPGADITDFNRYAVEWEADEIRWYVNDTLIGTERKWWSRRPDAAENYPHLAPFDQPFHIVLNLAVGGSFDPQGSKAMHAGDFPAVMLVAYVRVYVDFKKVE